MDNNGTSNCNQNRGENEGSSHLNSKKNELNRNKIISVLFFISVFFSVLSGWFLSELSALPAIFLSLIFGLACYCVGIISAVTWHVHEMSVFTFAAAIERQVREKMFLRKIDEVIQTERCDGIKMMVEMAKKVADRVANRILAKYVDGLTDSRKRDIVLKDVGDILTEEISAFQDAVQDELKKV